MNIPIVTLTTDWGNRDYYAAMVKGKLYSLIHDVRVVDLSHSQDWDSMAVVSRIIQLGCFSFPAGTVHIIDVGEDSSLRPSGGASFSPVPLLALCRGHYFLCSNRKLLEFSLNGGCESLVSLPLPSDANSYTFLSYTVFCDAAVRLLGGESPSQMGEPAPPLARREFLRAQFDGNILAARPACIDKYGNVTLNVSYDEFESYRNGRRFRVELEFQIGSCERCDSITGISTHYSSVRPGSLLLTVSLSGDLQLSINQGSVAQLMGVDYSTVCRILFY